MAVLLSYGYLMIRSAGMYLILWQRKPCPIKKRQPLILFIKLSLYLKPVGLQAFGIVCAFRTRLLILMSSFHFWNILWKRLFHRKQLCKFSSAPKRTWNYAGY